MHWLDEFWPVSSEKFLLMVWFEPVVPTFKPQAPRLCPGRLAKKCSKTQPQDPSTAGLCAPAVEHLLHKEVLEGRCCLPCQSK